MKKYRIIVLILVVLTPLFMCEGCGKQDDFNNVEILSTEKVVELLKENGVMLTRSYNFPIDLSLCKIHGKKPKPYFSRQTGVYYMFYEYDGYFETSILNKQISFYEYPKCDEQFLDSLIPCAGSLGKNLYVCLWYPELDSLADDMNKIQLENYNCIIKEIMKLENILKEKCFDKKVATLTGQGDSWEVKIPINYVYNKRVNEEGITETVFYAMDETFVKYLNSQKELPDVKSFGWKKESELEIRTSEENSLLGEENEDKYYRVSSHSSCFFFDPEAESNAIVVTITCRNGETEEIICSIEQTD